MMNADKQVLYSGVPQEDWQKNSKYPRIMSNGPKPPKTPEKSRRTSGLIPFLILTGVTLLISAGVVIGLHYIKYTEQDGLVFITGGSEKTSEESTVSGSDSLVPKPLPIDNKNPAESENPNTPQNPNDKASDQGKEASPKVEPLEKDSNAQVNPPKPEDGKDLISTTDDGNKKLESNSNTNINSEKIKDENPAETEKQQQQQQQQQTPEGTDITDDNEKVPDDTAAVDGKQNSEDIPSNNKDNITNDGDDDGDDDWFGIIKTDGDIIFKKPTTPKPKEIKETVAENQPTKKDGKEEKENDKKEQKEKEEKGEKEENVVKDLNKKDNDLSHSKEKEEHEEDNKTDEEKEDKDHEDTSLLYKAINNFAQKYFNSTNLNPTQVKDMLQNLSVGPSLEVIIIAAGIIFIGLSLLIIAITCLVTRTRKIKIRREKIKQAVSDLEGAEKVILLTDEQSEDEYVKA